MPRSNKVTQPSPAAGPDPVPSTTTSSTVPAPDHILRRRPQPTSSEISSQEKMTNDEARSIASSMDEEGAFTTTPASWASRNQWVVLAVASGACAAFNGVFAKLTTNDLTSNLSQAIAKTFGLGAVENVIELIVRCTFFGLNLVFNGVMWTLFTKALARGSSTTQVSIMNTSTNFMITAILGLMIFSESLPPLWWAGAAMLVAGNVIIGRKVEESKDSIEDDVVSIADSDTNSVSYGAVPLVAGVLPIEKNDDEEEDVALLGDLDESHAR